MEFRKLINFGKGSFIISIPKQWVNKNKLKKGDSIGFEDLGASLLLTTTKESAKKEEKHITINVENKDMERIETEIVSAYLNNYNTIEVYSNKLSVKAKDIKDILVNLAGLEILEQTATRMIAKDLIDIREISINTIIRRMDIITRSMISDIVGYCEGFDDYKSVPERDSDVNRLHFLAIRFIRNALKHPSIGEATRKDAWQLQSDKFVAQSIEQIADKQKRIARYLSDVQFDKDERKVFANIYQSIQASYKDIMKAYYNNDIKLAYDVELSHKQRLDECDNFLDNHRIKNIRKKAKTKWDLATAALIIENLKATASHVRGIGRNIFGG